MTFIRQLCSAAIFLAVATVLTGVIYPLAVTGLAQAVFNHQANGSLVIENGEALGSELIGQQFSNPAYFWGRLSATTPMPYDAAASSGSNLGPSNPALIEAVKVRLAALTEADPGNNQPVPVDLVTCSGSGLDPHVSPAAAAYQIPRVARIRGLSEEQVGKLVEHFTEDRQLGILGEPRVNVLKLNIALDAAKR